MRLISDPIDPLVTKNKTILVGTVGCRLNLLWRDFTSLRRGTGWHQPITLYLKETPFKVSANRAVPDQAALVRAP